MRVREMVFRRGRLDGRAVVAVESGVGKVNAALRAALLCDHFNARALVVTGVAGGLDPNLAVGDLVVGRRVVCHDYGLLAGEQIVPFQPGAMPLPGYPAGHGYDLPEDLKARIKRRIASLSLPALSARATGDARRRPRVVLGTILTGDTFVNSAAARERLHREFGGQAVEMEGAAVAQVAETFGVPSVVVRALSDLAGEESHLDFAAFAAEAGALAAQVVREILPEL